MDIIRYPELLGAMQAYNETLWFEKQAGLKDPWSYAQPSFSLSEYGLENEIFGVISIPKLDLEMPLYLGATTKHLAAGATHLSQTSLPIGGSNTNCVIDVSSLTVAPCGFKFLKNLSICLQNGYFQRVQVKVCFIEIHNAVPAGSSYPTDIMPFASE